MITNEQVQLAISEQVQNPIPLTNEIIIANGLELEWVEPGYTLWCYHQTFDVIQDVTPEGDEPYIFLFGESDESPTVVIQIKYEHQLKGLISLYN